MKKVPQCKFSVKATVISMCCTLLLYSASAQGLPSKRAVAPGEVVPEEDAFLESRTPMNAVITPETIIPPIIVDIDRLAPLTQAPPTQTQEAEKLHAVAVLDATDRKYAAVKIVDNGVWLKFSEGKSFLPDGTQAALAGLTRLKPEQHLVIISYIDNKLNATENDRLAHERALNLKKALLALNISKDKIIMLKPQASQVGNSFAVAADRLELQVQDKIDYPSDKVFTE